MADREQQSDPTRLVAGEADQGARLDRFLTERLDGVSRSRLQALIKAGAVQGAAGPLINPGHRLKSGEALVIDLPPPIAAEPEPENIALNVVFEDRHLIVVDKPAGLVVHPAAGHFSGTLVNALLAHCGESLSGIGGVKRPGIVHRLDKDTSGLLVVAKSDAAHQGLAAQFAAHGEDGRLTRRYRGLAWGALPYTKGCIDAALARSTSNRTKIAVVRSEVGRRAVTHYEVEARYDDDAGKPLASLVACELETGRTHQIRVHLAHIGHPLMGDPVYSTHFAASVRRLSEPRREALETLGRQALHAAHLGFEHPVTGKLMAFDSPFPPDLAALVAIFAGANATATPPPKRAIRARKG